MTGTLWRWDGTALVAAAEPDTAADVVDSWLEHDGYAGGWHLHRKRFADSLPGVDTAPFLDAVRGKVPHVGNWFPRVEAHGSDLHLRVRPAPALRSATVLWIPPTPDPRRMPLLKGPDLPALGELRARAQAHGADDAVLYSEDGLVVEGANCALAWWEDGELMIPEHPRRMPSVTVAATAEMLGRPGARPVTLRELPGFPVWAGSALHGWTRVTSWITSDGVRSPAAAADTPVGTELVNNLLRWN